ncbi:Lrp/AsnC ligand binding domain-containing protein [Pleomorphovibrio marinus]|uniref:Lrp/AsnC ligand binding domain-containing protein n=1 Tax=Pleomorphovibrio marinus TaxID=2164132 RepID=UPI000E0AE74A|nr:Lrp/AsnC ligand binding domain-containing protein [Pleomorphovibrio marinus]
MDKILDIDNIDLKIISLLNEDAKTPYTEIAKKVFVSSGTVHVRMRKLEEMGIVKSATLNIDFSKLGYDISAFLGIYLEKSSLYDNVIERLKEIAEVINAYYTTGNYSIFAKIICKDTNHLRDVLNKIQMVEGIDRTETLIVLEESINRPIQLFQESNGKKEEEI